jgi:hypothetical protein
MQNNESSKIINDDLIEPSRNGWRLRKNHGSWGITPHFDFSNLSTAQANSLLCENVDKTLDSFLHLARPYFVSIYSFHDEIPKGLTIEWKNEISCEDYIKKFSKAIQEYPEPLYEVTIRLDLYVYVFTQEDNLSRSWIRLLGNELVMSSGPDRDSSYFRFDTSCTLFGPATSEISPLTGPYGEYEGPKDSNKLQLLNQPLLEKTLQKWEDFFGEITEVEGTSGIQKYGFLVEPY